MNAPVVMERQVPSFQVAQKTAEISQVQFIDRVVRFFCRATDSVPTVQTVQKIVQIIQMQFLEKGNDDTRCSATPGVHGSGGAENSVEEIYRWTTTG